MTGGDVMAPYGFGSAVDQVGHTPLIPVRHDEVDGIEMEVLDDGTPYLTARGLAKICCIFPSILARMTIE